MKRKEKKKNERFDGEGGNEEEMEREGSVQRKKRCRWLSATELG